MDGSAVPPALRPPELRPPELRLENVTATHERHPAVHHLSGCFAQGSLTAVVGPNGAGKTTLLRVLAGLHPHEGRIDRGGLPPDRIALLAQGGGGGGGQGSGPDRSFPISCLDVVALGHWGRVGAFGRIGPDLRDRAREALATVGLRGFEARPVSSLSAGQFQRVLFARLLAQDAPVLLLDEPFNAVDARTVADLVALVRRWHAEGRTVVAVLHDLELVAREFPQTLLLAREAIAWGPTAAALSPANRLRARMLSEAWAEAPGLCRDAA